MLWTRTLIPTSKEAPADATVPSHVLMLRAGLIRQVAAGIFDFLPLGLRSLHKAAAIVREQISAIGAAEVLLPALQPAELWRQSGREATCGQSLFRVKDRHGRAMLLGPAHDELISELVAAYVRSYRQLPLTLYQIGTQFRDEERPRLGLLGVREFLMMDAYGFHATQQSLDETCDNFRHACERILQRCGIRAIAIEAEPAPIGGKPSIELVVACDVGQDLFVTSDRGNYAASLQRAATGQRPHDFSGQPTGELTKVHTPGLPGIDAVADFMKVRAQNMLKTLVFRAEPMVEVGRPESLASPKWLVAVVRGDHDVNESKLIRAARQHFHIERIVLEDTPQVRATWAIGFAGPDAAFGNPDAVVLIDPDAAQGGFWVTGANEVDYHVAHFNWFRECGDKLADPRKVVVADIRNAVDGDPSPMNDGGVLRLVRGIRLGHVLNVGTRYSEALGARFLDERGQARPILMGCCGIDLCRLLVAAIESSYDQHGIVWPAALAPFSVVITPIRYEGESKAVADRLLADLTAAGIDTILDDRPDVRPGVKFADADLIGFPLRVNVGQRGLARGSVEMKLRRDPAPREIALSEAVHAVREALAEVAEPAILSRQ
ncbi:proline--tRNA ligase [Fontivita pretiosa]|uniref:proline--tRNA ligase n=1 Tax=Fontivita pretiosa TaxID=2989684 RepID=UPI003D180258